MARGDQECEPVAIGPVVHDVVGVFQKQHPGRLVRLSIQHGLVAVGAQGFCEEIIENLLSNADKYSPADQPIDVDVHPLDGSVVICVSDRGAGVPEVDQQRIFDLFSRLAPEREIPGLGIGLSLCKRLVTLMDGELQYSSRPGGGSCFSLYLGTYIDTSVDSALVASGSSRTSISR